MVWLRALLIVGLGLVLGERGLASGGVGGDVAELSRRIAKEKDKVDPSVFQELAAIGDSSALAALQKSVTQLKKLPTLEAAYGALATFSRAPGELSTEARRFLTREVFRAKNKAAKPAAMRHLLTFGDAALPGIERALSDHADPLVRRYACDALVQRLAVDAKPEGLEHILVDASLDSMPARVYLGVEESVSASYAGLDHRGVVRRALEAFPRADSSVPLAAKLHDPRTPRGWKLLLVDLFASRGDAASLEVLGDTLDDEDSAVVLEVLARLTANEAAEGFAERLRPLFRSKQAAVRKAAVVALGQLEIRDVEAQGEIIELSRSADSALRMGAAAALVELRTPEAIEVLHHLIVDEEWPVRAEAIAQAVRLRNKATIPILIERLDVERGRLREDVYGGLAVLSGKDLGRASTRWRRWWENEGSTFVVPPVEELERAAKARREREAEAGSTRGPTFYGVEVFSERVCFVLDVSGSMRLNAGEGVDPNGPQDPDKPSRMDVAKDQLADIVRAFPDGKYFNLIFFESEVRSLDERLVKMKKSVRQKSLRFIREQYSLGGTALYPALRLAFDDPLVDTIYLISDGAPTEGEVTEIEEIRAEVRRWNSARRVRIHGITIGQDSTLLRWLTEDTGGTYTRRD